MPYLQHILFYPVPFLLVLNVLVFVHEAGHFIVARACGVRVAVFSVGLGRELLGWTDRRGTRWKLCLLPFGGYVRMQADGTAAGWLHASDSSSALSEAERRSLFVNKPLAVRLAVVLGGPAANILLTILIFTVVIAIRGENFTPPVITAVKPGMPAEAAGFKPGDRIVELDGRPIRRSEDVVEITLLHPGDPLVAIVENKGAQRRLTVTPRIVLVDNGLGSTQPDVRIGVDFMQTPEIVKPPLPRAFARACRQTGWYIKEQAVTLWQMIMGRRSTEQMNGAITVAKASHIRVHEGIQSTALLMAHLSLALGVFNLLPVPVLDGGYIVFYAVEAMFGKRASAAAMRYTLSLGLALIALVTITLLWNDLSRTGVLGFFTIKN